MTRPVLPEGVYGMTAEKLSKGRSNVEVVRAMIAGGVRVLQYREKRPFKQFREMVEECREIRRLTREASVLFLVDDFPTLAKLADADGLHIGQDDWPLAEIRQMLGPDKIIGLSTHAREHALAAIKQEPDYIGVGPIYTTTTKEDAVAAMGLEYLDFVKKNVNLPFVALGGIKESNIKEVIARGARSVCLVSDIVEADDISAKVRRLQAMF